MTKHTHLIEQQRKNDKFKAAVLKAFQSIAEAVEQLSTETSDLRKRVEQLEGNESV